MRPGRMTIDFGENLAARLRENARLEGFTFAELMRSLGRAYLKRRQEVCSVCGEDQKEG